MVSYRKKYFKNKSDRAIRTKGPSHLRICIKPHEHKKGTRDGDTKEGNRLEHPAARSSLNSQPTYLEHGTRSYRSFSDTAVRQIKMTTPTMTRAKEKDARHKIVIIIIRCVYIVLCWTVITVSRVGITLIVFFVFHINNCMFRDCFTLYIEG